MFILQCCWLQLIKPEEMTNPKVDEQSMMTYLSQFPNAKLDPSAPIRPRTNAARVRAYGPGKCSAVVVKAQFYDCLSVQAIYALLDFKRGSLCGEIGVKTLVIHRLILQFTSSSSSKLLQNVKL